MSQCAIPGCFDPCRSRQLMCKWHWRKVPADIKAKVLEAWKPVGAKIQEGDDLGIRLRKIRHYRDMVAVAVAYVCGLEGIKREDQPEAPI